MKKWLKRIAGVTAFLVVILGGIYFLYFNDPVPTGSSPEQADALAREILEALNAEAYRETRYLDWSYRGGRNRYHWDKVMGKVEMSWGDFWGRIDLVSPEKSRIEEEGIPVKGERLKQLTQEAISNFNNDSFWLVAPFKVFDKGTKRSLVQMPDRRPGLLVTYTQGGDTPGDSYLWELNEENFPVSYRMWVQILPLKGLSATWEGWQPTESGVWLPQYHKIGPITLDLGKVSTSR